MLKLILVTALKEYFIPLLSCASSILLAAFHWLTDDARIWHWDTNAVLLH